MTWRWLIFFKLLVVVPAAQVTVHGKVELRDSHEAAVQKNRDYSGVVISLRPVNLATPVPLSSKHAEMLQKNKTFRPHILPVEVGTTIDFPNADPIFHNAFSSYSGQIFDIGLYAPGTSRSVRFKRPGIVRVFCNIHFSMSAVIVVLETPYFTRTDKNGGWEIKAPEGQYVLDVYHERAAEATLHSLSRRVALTNETVEAPVIVISEAGYLLTTHKNKHGQEYPPVADDQVFYPGVKK